jgi:hypothetical protein
MKQNKKLKEIIPPNLVEQIKFDDISFKDEKQLKNNNIKSNDK